MSSGNTHTDTSRNVLVAFQAPLIKLIHKINHVSKLMLTTPDEKIELGQLLNIIYLKKQESQSNSVRLEYIISMLQIVTQYTHLLLNAVFFTCMMYLRFLSVVVQTRNLFLSINEQYIVVWKYHNIFLISFPVAKHEFFLLLKNYE